MHSVVTFKWDSHFMEVKQDSHLPGTVLTTWTFENWCSVSENVNQANHINSKVALLIMCTSTKNRKTEFNVSHGGHCLNSPKGTSILRNKNRFFIWLLQQCPSIGRALHKNQICLNAWYLPNITSRVWPPHVVTQTSTVNLYVLVQRTSNEVCCRSWVAK